MRNANAVAVRAFSLTLTLVSIGGCDMGAAPPPQTPSVTSESLRDRLPTVRVQVDAARNRVWFLTQTGVFVHDASRSERVAIALPGWVTVGAAHGCPPDMALGPKGEALITSNIMPTLWRIDPDSLAVSVHPLALDADTDKDVGFSGLVYSPQHGTFLAASFHHGSLWRIDPPLERAQKIPLSAPIPKACGLAVRSRSGHQGLRPLPDLCVQTPHGGWSVIFAAGWRSAYVSAAPCAEGT
jgi:hypothetical protein